MHKQVRTTFVRSGKRGDLFGRPSATKANGAAADCSRGRSTRPQMGSARMAPRWLVRSLSTDVAHASSGTTAAALRRQTSRLPVSKLPPLQYEENISLRRKHLAPALSTHYSESQRGALKLSFGQGQYLYDETGDRYLDCVNNVCHIGHCHPRTVQAAATQLAQLNTNSRYLHDNIVRLGQEITATMPDPLEVVVFCNSGSEANDLALRLARNYTERKHVYCVDGAYHGNT